jgi:hypothetical protein
MISHIQSCKIRYNLKTESVILNLPLLQDEEGFGCGGDVGGPNRFCRLDTLVDQEFSFDCESKLSMKM